jgi:cellulose synthase/poly-beta-1,6-N-acetylglucosamine synthase-like glycosyltransferase
MNLAEPPVEDSVMVLALEIACWLAVAVVLLPMTVLVVELVAALLPRRNRVTDAAAPRPRCAVLIPAHDEEQGLGRTLDALRPQLRPGDRLLVVADNCTDRTAEVARAGGAEVVERHDPQRRGKGFALDCGVRHLAADAPEVVVIMDADCRAEDGTLTRLACEAARTGRPVQAEYVLEAPAAAGWRGQVSAFAFLVKNVVRPLGLARLGLPCLLTGTGMAFPWSVLRHAQLASGNLVEDMQLGLDLAVAGRPPLLCPGARVVSDLPAGRPAAAAQRTRWEHGHLRTLLTQVPRLLGLAVVRRRPDLLGLALELSVPPLSVLLLLWGILAGALLGVAAAGGPAAPAAVLAFGGAAGVLAVLAAWRSFGRNLSIVLLLAAPLYALAKLPIYLRFLFRRQRAWLRTQRS